MKLIDLLNWFGIRKQFRLGGKLLLLLARNIPFPLLIRIAGRRVVSAFAGAPAILLTKSTMEEAVKDPQLLYKAIKYTVETMKLDTMCLLADMSLEAEACGCKVNFDDYSVPSVMTHPVNINDDFTELKIPDPHESGRMPVFLETMYILKKNFTMLKIGEVSGPFTLATSLGGTDIYMEIRRNPERVEALLEYCEKVIIRYAKALIKSGADMILVAEPTGSQLSAPVYANFSLPYTINIIKALNRQCILHICSNAEHIIDHMCQSGAVALSIDDVDISRVIKRVPLNIVVIGNISPLKFARYTPDEIVDETMKLLENIKDRKGFLVAPGCDLAPQTPEENILAFTETVARYQKT